MGTHLLVGNPTAQSGRNAERIERARQGLARRGIPAELLATLPAGATIAAVRAALDAGHHRVVIAMGGDGTFREVASGLLGSRRRDEIALAMLPTGTANDQGKSFGLAAGEGALDDNLDVIAAAHETRLDAGRLRALDEAGVAHESWFFDSAGWGLSARVLRERNQDRSWIDRTIPALGAIYRDHLVYAGALLRVLLQSVVEEELSARVVADGTVHDFPRLTDLVVKNTRIYGGAWVFDKTSRHDDGLFEIVPFQGRNDWLSKAIVDLDGNPIDEATLNQIAIVHSRPIRAARIEIQIDPGGAPLHAQLDGEETLATRTAVIEVVPRCVRLVVPRQSER